MKRSLPRTDEVLAMAAEQRGVEHLAGTILLDRYRLVELLGTGGASAVYRAEHTIMQKSVAVKILRPELTLRQDFVQRFLGEARTVARLRHENIVDIVDIGRTENGVVFCVMELLEGEELGTTLEREGRMPWPRARNIILQVCRALATTHAAGIVHRDVKPQNCFCVRRAGRPDFIKLLDFGICKETKQDHGLTETGVVLGTAEYMSPEQARGKEVDARADIYSVGAMLFEMLVGEPPFVAESFVDVLMKQISERPPRPSARVPGLPRAIDDVIAHALAKNREDRYQTMEQLVAALVAIDRPDHPLVNDDVDMVTTRSNPVGRADMGPTVSPATGADTVSASATAPHPVAARLVGLDRRMVVIVALGLLLVPLAALGVLALLSERDEERSMDRAAGADPPPLIADEPTRPPTMGPETSPPPPSEPSPTREAQPPQSSPIVPEKSQSPSDAAVEERASEPTLQPTSPTADASGAAPVTKSPIDPREKARKELRASILKRCKERGQQKRTLVVSVKGNKAGLETLTPRHGPLEECIESVLRTAKMPGGTFKLTIGLPPPT